MGVNALQILGVLPHPSLLPFLSHLPSPSSPLLVSLSLPSPPSPLIQLEGLGECCKLPQRVRAKPATIPLNTFLVHLEVK